MTALAAWLMDRTGRERWLLAALAGLAVPLALWLAVVQPLLAARAVARADLSQAEGLHAWVMDRLTDAAALPAPPPRPAPVGLAGLESRLAGADLGATGLRLADAGDGAVAISLDGVEFTRLMAWLDGVEGAAGYRVAALRLAPGAVPGQVQAEVRLEP